MWIYTSSRSANRYTGLTGWSGFCTRAVPGSLLTRLTTAAFGSVLGATLAVPLGKWHWFLGWKFLDWITRERRVVMSCRSCESSTNLSWLLVITNQLMDRTWEVYIKSCLHGWNIVTSFDYQALLLDEQSVMGWWVIVYGWVEAMGIIITPGVVVVVHFLWSFLKKVF